MNRLNPKSIRFQLSAYYAAILAITFCAVAVLVWLTLRQSIKDTVDKELRARLVTVRAYVDGESRGEGASHLHEELTEDAVFSPASTNLRIADKAGSWIYRSPGTENWNLSVPKREDLPFRGRAETMSITGKPMRVLSAPVKIGAVQIALPLDEFEELQRDFIWSIVLGMPLLLCVASVGGYWMSGRALRPVEQIANAAKRITAQNLSERLPSSGTGDELDRLSQVLNEMLAGLQSSFTRIMQFTADASHELRTPFAIIRTTAEVICGRTRTLEEHDKAWRSVLAQTERTSGLINDLLTLARADSGSDALHFEPTALDHVVTAACADMQVLADSKGLQLTFAHLPQCTVFGDGDALRRVLSILLDNAIHATSPPGSIDVSATLQSDGPLQVAVVAVKDSGTGISPEDLQHIFDRFYRADTDRSRNDRSRKDRSRKDRSRNSGGAGLGLSIAQWIVTRHRGTIQVQSRLGVGSTFRVRLPLLSDEKIPFRDSSESRAILNPR